MSFISLNTKQHKEAKARLCIRLGPSEALQSSTLSLSHSLTTALPGTPASSFTSAGPHPETLLSVTSSVIPRRWTPGPYRVQTSTVELPDMPKHILSESSLKRQFKWLCLLTNQSAPLQLCRTWRLPRDPPFLIQWIPPARCRQFRVWAEERAWSGAGTGDRWLWLTRLTPSRRVSDQFWSRCLI